MRAASACAEGAGLMAERHTLLSACWAVAPLRRCEEEAPGKLWLRQWNTNRWLRVWRRWPDACAPPPDRGAPHTTPDMGVSLALLLVVEIDAMGRPGGSDARVRSRCWRRGPLKTPQRRACTHNVGPAAATRAAGRGGDASNFTGQRADRLRCRLAGVAQAALPLPPTCCSAAPAPTTSSRARRETRSPGAAPGIALAACSTGATLRHSAPAVCS